ncbi:MAG: hypothetical protein JXQ75_18060 [Phycisphaerae bacterium]|nr:hypothetical protein [Phycisphaerae bacterium]
MPREVYDGIWGIPVQSGDFSVLLMIPPRAFVYLRSTSWIIIWTTFVRSMAYLTDATFLSPLHGILPTITQADTADTMRLARW